MIHEFHSCGRVIYADKPESMNMAEFILIVSRSMIGDIEFHIEPRVKKDGSWSTGADCIIRYIGLAQVDDPKIITVHNPEADSVYDEDEGFMMIRIDEDGSTNYKKRKIRSW